MHAHIQSHFNIVKTLRSRKPHCIMNLIKLRVLCLKGKNSPTFFQDRLRLRDKKTKKRGSSRIEWNSMSAHPEGLGETRNSRKNSAMCYECVIAWLYRETLQNHDDKLCSRTDNSFSFR